MYTLYVILSMFPCKHMFFYPHFLNATWIKLKSLNRSMNKSACVCCRAETAQGRLKAHLCNLHDAAAALDII